VKKAKSRTVRTKNNGRLGVKFSPYLMLVDNALPAVEDKTLIERLDRKHIRDGRLSGEGFVEIDLVGCEALELIEGSQHEVMLHHGWGRARPVSSAVVAQNEKRGDERYAGQNFIAWARPIGFFDRSSLKRACLLDFSVSGVGLVCSKKLEVNKKVLLQLEFSDGATFDVKGVVVRNEASPIPAAGFMCGIRLNELNQSLRDCMVTEGLHMKLKKC